jgi:uncharacterized protein
MLISRYGFGLLLALICQLAAAGVYEDMIAAVKANHIDVIDALLKRGFDVNAVDREGNTLLMIAAKEGSPAATTRLLAAHPKVNARNEFGETALMLASIQGHLDIVRSLLIGGADSNQPGWTPLMYAAANGHINIARLLISYGALVNATADNGYTALMMAAREGHADLVSLLLSHGANPGLKAASGATAMSIARDKNHHAIVESLAKGAR